MTTVLETRLTGLGCGFLGIVSVMIDRIGGSTTHWIGIVALIGAAVSWALGVIYLKRYPVRVDVLWLAALQSIIGSVPLIALGLAVEPDPVRFGWTFVWTLGYVGSLGTALGFLLWVYLAQRRETNEVGAYIFLVPFVAVISSVLILGERFGASSVVGGALVFTGIYLVNRTISRKSGRTFKHPTASTGSTVTRLTFTGQSVVAPLGSAWLW